MSSLTSNKKTIGNAGESLAAAYYAERGYEIIDRNVTFRNGEIDIVCKKDGILIFVEAKVVNYIYDLADYITPRKLMHLSRSIDIYCQQHAITSPIRLDVIFVRNDQIIECYENVTL
jgi:putative endonuclease